MAYQMKVSNDKIEGQEIFPAGIYDVKFVKFSPSVSKSGTSTNLNAMMEVVGHPEYAGRKLYETLNDIGIGWQDFSHCFGIPMETDGKSSWFAGDWDGDPVKFKADDPKTFVYKGPLTGRTGKVEVTVDNYNGRDNNKVMRYFCAIPDCATKFPKVRHIENMLKNSKS